MEKVTRRIQKFNETRLPAMIQEKYKVMATDLYKFYRGTNHLFYEDLKKSGKVFQSPLAWICGDLHLENFGSFKSDNRLVYFDLNDFDEALLAPAIFEVVRMVTSIFVAFESLRIEQKKAINMAQLFLKTYSSILEKGKPNYIEPRVAKGIVCQFLVNASKRKTKDILKKKARVKNKKIMLLNTPKHLKLPPALKKELFNHIAGWLKNDGGSPYNYIPIDAAFRVAGTGSLGQIRYIILLKSSNGTGEKYLLLDMKEATPPSLLPYVRIKQPQWNTNAERIITIQQRMQNRPPALLSATVFKKMPFVIEELQPTEDSINFNLIKKDYRNIYQVIDDMAMLTASSQLRSSGEQGSSITDELKEFGAKKDWQEKVLTYAIHYVSQIKTDYINFLRDYKKGVLKNHQK
ncbi:DUF2252 family protein [Ferruginibacter albus]|uniref:DUF2252 family protein n=1 Tax=Ferruginibacter albus TaxID=2875540 RepID=UPI001CC48E4B|nr:DUF2252 family protein [Ferruginibacter albus]UAY53077.1 DUF2252 domain-containing protein [Ferruginibacter albus]